MKHVKKRLTVCILVSVLLIALGGGTVVTYQAAASQIISSKEWSYIDDNYYSVQKFSNGNTALLFKQLQEKDFEAIQEELVDHSIAPNNELVKLAAEDPDAVLPDNMLPDGRFLIENWERKAETLQKDLSTVSTIAQGPDGHEVVSKANKTDPKLTVTFSNQESLACKKVEVDGSTVTVPINFWNVNCGITFLSKEKGLLLTTDNALTILDPHGNTTEISPPTYNNKTFEQISQEAEDMRSIQPVFWNGYVSVNEERNLISYVSNKADPDGSWDLYLLDIDSGKEAKLADDAKFFYLVEQWLDASHVLCTKIYDTAQEMVVVDTEGKETPLNFAVDSPIILGARDGVVAYGNETNDIIYFDRYDNNKLYSIGKVSLDGTFRIRPGIDPFSPDGTKFAYILNPKDNELGRDIVVVDLDTMITKENKSVPFGTKKTTGVLEFNWLDNTELFVSIIQNQRDISSWIYCVK